MAAIIIIQRKKLASVFDDFILFSSFAHFQCYAHDISGRVFVFIQHFYKNLMKVNKHIKNTKRNVNFEKINQELLLL